MKFVVAAASAEPAAGSKRKQTEEVAAIQQKLPLKKTAGDQPVMRVKIKEGKEKIFVYNSFSVKDQLKMLGFRFNNEERAWERELWEVLALKRGRLFKVAADVTLDQLLLLVKDVPPEAMDSGPNEKWAQEGPSGVGLYLNVPFKDKEQAKNLGAHWDYVKKKWFVHKGEDTSKYSKWLP